MNNLQAPGYSLHDLFKDLKNGIKDRFTYNGKTYMYSMEGIRTVITDEKGYKAIDSHYIGSMTDLQGMAACLDEYKRDLSFDREGNIVS